MTLPRSHLITPGKPGHFHIVSRCVRRSFLCGHDPITRADYSHRKQWILDRIAELTPSYAIEINGYAVMNNHFHLAVYVDPRETRKWSDEQVADRWLRAYPPAAEAGDPAPGKTEKNRMLANPDLLAQRRNQLGSLSHFIKNIKQPIARRANREDGCTGHFFEGRFFSGQLLDVAAIVNCLAYIDLNPVRAGIARSLKDCDLTAVVERIRRSREEPEGQNLSIRAVFSGLPQSASGLSAAGVSITMAEYLHYCDSKRLRHRENRAIEHFKRRQRAYGSRVSLETYSAAIGLQRIRSQAIPASPF